MSRRDFLKMTGTASALAMTGLAGRRTFAADSPMDLSRLKARNRDRSTVVAQHGIVCTSQPLATMAGIDVLKAGGNCVDAAICANAMLGLTEAAACGIGGDLFAILWIEKDQKLYGLNASGRSPYAWNLDEAKKRELTRSPARNPLSWSVPGCVSGWGMLNERFGKKSLAECLDASVGYAPRWLSAIAHHLDLLHAWPSMPWHRTWPMSITRMAKFPAMETSSRTRR